MAYPRCHGDPLRRVPVTVRDGEPAMSQSQSSARRICSSIRRRSAARRALVCAIALAGASLVPGVAEADSCAARPVDGMSAVSVRSGGRERIVAVYFPVGFRAGQCLPLVFDLHGSKSNGEGQAAVSGMRAVADRHHFIVANPTGGIAFAAPDSGHGWNIPGVPLFGGAQVPADAPDDVQFIADTISTLAAAHCVDPRRVYATGLSGGARMSSLLACRLSGRNAAVAPVAGVRAGNPAADDPAEPDPASCVPERAVPILTFHGTADDTNPYAGGGAAYWRYSVPQALERWAQLNGCRPRPERQSAGYHVTRLRYRGCRNNAEVVLYLTDAPVAAGGGHIWPRLAKGNAPGNAGQLVSLDASEIIARFFERHPMSR